MIDKLWKFLAWLDRWANDVLLRGRWETISSRCYRRQWTKGCRFCGWLCGLLHRIDPYHCKKAYETDIARNPNIPRVDY